MRATRRRGVTAIQIEDQEFPKKCGHTPFKRLVPIEDMVEKIKVAIDARSSEDFLVIARTDARQSEGFDSAMRRMEAYSKAGADILFPEALTSEEEMRKACSSFDKPMFANMANGGLTPILPVSTLREIGYSIAIFPSMAALAAAAAIRESLLRLKRDGDCEPADVPMTDFKHFCSLIGFDEVWAFEKKWAR